MLASNSVVDLTLNDGHVFDSWVLRVKIPSVFCASIVWPECGSIKITPVLPVHTRSQGRTRVSAAAIAIFDRMDYTHIWSCGQRSICCSFI